MTVPQHPWLWSRVDDISGHERRYTAKSLLQRVTEAGFEVLYSTSFVSLLLPALWVSRKLADRRVRTADDVVDSLRAPRWLDDALHALLAPERAALVRAETSLPVGSSRLLVARLAR